MTRYDCALVITLIHHYFELLLVQQGNNESQQIVIVDFELNRDQKLMGSRFVFTSESWIPEWGATEGWGVVGGASPPHWEVRSRIKKNILRW